MKKLMLFFCFLFAMTFHLEAQSISQQVRLGGAMNEEITQIIKDQNGDYVVTAFSISNEWEDYISTNYGFEDVWLLKLDDQFNILWSNVFGTNGNDRIWRQVECPDGSIAMVGYVQSSVPPSIFNTPFGSEELDHQGDFDVLLLKISSSGTLLWVKNFGGSDHDEGKDLVVLDNGDLILTGYTESTDGDVSTAFGGRDLWLIKTDSDGNVLWERSYGGSDDEEGRSLAVNGGDIWITGYSKSEDGDVANNFGTRDVWLLSVDAGNGDINWEKSYGGDAGDIGTNVVTTQRNYSQGGGYILGQSISNNAFGESLGADDVILLSIDQAGELIWSKVLGGEGSDAPRSLAYRDLFFAGDIGFENVLFLGGSSFSENFNGTEFEYENQNGWILLCSGFPNTHCETYDLPGGNDEDALVTVLPGGDDLFCAGFTRSTDGDLGKHGAHDGWVFSYNATGTGTNAKQRAFEIYPNPVKTSLNVLSDLNNLNWKLYNIKGQIIDSDQSESNAEIKISLQENNIGIYFLELCSEGICTTQKVIKE